MNLFDIFQRTKPGEYNIRYVLKGTKNDFNITYKCGEGCEVIQEAHVKKGWTYKFIARTGQYFYISAQSNTADSSVDLKVYQNGKAFKKITKSGNFPTVAAFGNIQ